jgi:hypothetical protein
MYLEHMHQISMLPQITRLLYQLPCDLEKRIFRYLMTGRKQRGWISGHPCFTLPRDGNHR